MNYLALGDHIVTRLKESGPPANVQATIDLTTVTEKALLTPAIYVYYISDNLGSNAGQGVSYEIRQTWGVALVVKNLRESEHRRAELGSMISDVINVIQGWQPPSDNYSRLYRENAPGPVENPGGYIYFPLHFSSRFLTNGTR